MIADTLKSIVDQTPGAAGAILMGFDGIAVMQVLAEGMDVDLEAIAMEFSFRFIELKKAAESLDMGEISDITVKAERGTLLVRCLSDEYFACVLLGDPGHFGKGRWVLRSSAPKLVADL